MVHVNSAGLGLFEGPWSPNSQYLTAMDLDPLLLHAEAGDVEALKAELEGEGPKRLRCRDPDRRTALHRACANGHEEAAKLLLAQGAQAEVEDEEGWTPLHSSSSRGSHQIVHLLIEAGTDVDAVTSSGATALHFAAAKGHEEVIRTLLAARAKVNLRDRSGGTPLLRAAGAGRLGALQRLLEAQADVSCKDKAGENVFHVAINGHQVEMCDLLFERDEAEKLMTQENAEGKTAAQLLLDFTPMEVRDKIKSIWREKRGG
ncbi:unnamed protein product [Effrenium voratum]|nr:unnamed protein product [Effrenium voratum]